MKSLQKCAINAILSNSIFHLIDKRRGSENLYLYNNLLTIFLSSQWFFSTEIGIQAEALVLDDKWVICNNPTILDKSLSYNFMVEVSSWHVRILPTLRLRAEFSTAIISILFDSCL